MSSNTEAPNTATNPGGRRSIAMPICFFTVLAIFLVGVPLFVSAWTDYMTKEAIEKRPLAVANMTYIRIDRLERNTGQEVIDIEVLPGDGLNDILVMNTALGEYQSEIDGAIALTFTKRASGSWSVSGDWKDDASKQEWVEALNDATPFGNN